MLAEKCWVVRKGKEVIQSTVVEDQPEFPPVPEWVLNSPHLNAPAATKGSGKIHLNALWSG